MMRNVLVLLTLAVFSFAVAVPADAEFTLKPSVSVRGEYDDNIYLTADDEEEDFITTISPGVSLGYESERLKASLGYRFLAWFYLHNSRENETSHNAQFDSTLTLLREILFLRVTDSYSRVTIDERRQVVQDNRTVNTTDSNRFTVNPYLQYPLSGTLRLNAGYVYENIWYKEEGGYDEESHLGTVGLTKELSPKLSASVAYVYAMHDVKLGGDLNDYDNQNVALGARYQMTQKLSISGSYGYAWLDYKKRDDYDSDMWNAGAQYRLSETISFDVGYAKGFASSVDAGVSETETLSASLSRQGPLSLTFRGFTQESTYIEEDRKDESSGVSLSASYPITPSMTGRIAGIYTYYKFRPEDEKVNRYGASVSFDYAMRLMTFSLGYSHDLSDSNVEANDYRNNRVWIEARMSL